MFSNNDEKLLDEIAGYLQDAQKKLDEAKANAGIAIPAIQQQFHDIVSAAHEAFAKEINRRELMHLASICSYRDVFQTNKQKEKQTKNDELRFKEPLIDALVALLMEAIKLHNIACGNNKLIINAELYDCVIEIKNYIYKLCGITDDGIFIRATETYDAIKIEKKLREIIEQAMAAEKAKITKETPGDLLNQQQAIIVGGLTRQLRAIESAITTMGQTFQPQAPTSAAASGGYTGIIEYIANKFCQEIDALAPQLTTVQRQGLAAVIDTDHWPMPASLLSGQAPVPVDLAFLYDYYQIIIDPVCSRKIGLTPLLEKYNAQYKQTAFYRDHYYYLGMTQHNDKTTDRDIHGAYDRVKWRSLAECRAQPVFDQIVVARDLSKRESAYEVLKTKTLRDQYDIGNQEAREAEKAKQIANLPEELLIAFLHLAIETNNEKLCADICKRFEVSPRSKQEEKAAPNEAELTLKQRVILACDPQGENALYKVNRLKRITMRAKILGRGAGLALNEALLEQKGGQVPSTSASPNILHDKADLTKQDRAELQKFCAAIKKLLDLDEKTQEAQYGIAVPTLKSKKEERAGFIKLLQEFYDAVNPIATYQLETKQEVGAVEKRAGDALLNLLEKTIDYCNDRSKQKNRQKIAENIIKPMEGLLIKLQGFRVSDENNRAYPNAIDKKVQDKNGAALFLGIDQTLIKRQEEKQKKIAENAQKERESFAVLFTTLQQTIDAVDILIGSADSAEVVAFKEKINKTQLTEVSDDMRSLVVKTQVITYVLHDFKKDIAAIKEKLSPQKQQRLDEAAKQVNILGILGQNFIVTLLHSAIQEDDVEQCSFVCDGLKSDIARVILATDENGQNALHKAFQKGHKTMCECLLENFDELSAEDTAVIAKAALARDKDHKTPFAYAAKHYTRVAVRQKDHYYIQDLVRPYLFHDNASYSEQDAIMLTDFCGYLDNFVKELNKKISNPEDTTDSDVRSLRVNLRNLIEAVLPSLKINVAQSQHAEESMTEGLLSLYKAFIAFHNRIAVADRQIIKNVLARIEHLIINLQGFKLPSDHVKPYPDLAGWEPPYTQVKDIEKVKLMAEGLERILDEQINKVFQQREERIGYPTKARHDHFLTRRDGSSLVRVLSDSLTSTLNSSASSASSAAASTSATSAVSTASSASSAPSSARKIPPPG